MKGKITIVLFSLVLVFGMLAASCDNGAFPDKDDKDATTYFAYASADGKLPDVPIKPMKAQAVYDKLQEKEPYPEGSETSTDFRPSYKLGKVAVLAEWAEKDTDSEAIKAEKKEKRELAAKYEGMQIIVRNTTDFPIATP